MKRGYRPFYLLVLVSLFAASGSSCPSRPAPAPLPPPAPPPQTLSEVIEAINFNSQRIHQLSADDVKLVLPGAPTLKADLAWQRPRRFRMRAELLSMTGAELDLGSNDDYFWMWVRRNEPPAVYFARHDDFARRPARHIIPIDPLWLIEALGVVYLDPALRHEGPYSRRAGQLEIHSKVPSADGELTKVTVIDETHRWVLQQHVYDHRGRLLATAIAKRHRYYPAEGVSLPQHVEIHLPPAQLSFQIYVDHFAINQLYGDPSQLWQPQLTGYPLIDITDPSFQTQSAPAAGQPLGGGYSSYDDLRSGSRPRYRGVGVRR